jgi:hypothetical protein
MHAPLDKKPQGWLHELIQGIRSLPPQYSFPLFALLIIVALAFAVSHWRAASQQCGDIDVHDADINNLGDHDSGVLVDCEHNELPAKLQ